MPFIGNQLSTSFQNVETQTITGDGSTSYTLNNAVADGKDLLVYINNVKQEEGSGKSYTATGTTITFSDAVASTDSCYVVFIGQAIGTVTPKDGSIVSSMLADANLEMPNTLDLNGKELILDADADTSITADTDDQIDIKIAGSDNLRIKSNEIENVSGDFTLDVAGNITLDADGTVIALADGGTEFAQLFKPSGGGFSIYTPVSDSDFKVVGNDGGSTVTALTLDMSNAGAASFNSFIYLDYIRGNSDINTGINITGSDVLAFQTGGSEHMRIDSSGKVLIGTTQQRGHMTLQIEGDGSASTSQGSIFLRRGLNTSSIGGNVGADLGLIQFGDNDGGIYANIEAKSDASAANNDYPGRLQFGTTADGASSPTERMRIDSSGNVGIAAIPSGEAASAHVVRLGDQVCISEYDDGSNPEQFNLFHNSDSAETYIETGTASVIQQRAGEIIFKNAASGSAGAAISFAERMRMDSSGNLGIGRTAASSVKLDVEVSSTNHPARFSSDHESYGTLFENSASSGNRFFCDFRINNSTKGKIFSDGSTTTFSTSSDYRLKENVVTDWDATTRLKQLKPSRFNFKENKDTTYDGFLAHEVSSIVPEAVDGEKDAVDSDGNIDPQGIDHSKLVPLMVKTIQELEARIAKLEAK